MAQIIQKAPGKIILFGEHAVVYGKPAIAVPIMQCYTTVTIQPLIHQHNIVQIQAPDIGLNCPLAELEPEHPFALIISMVRQLGKLHHLPAMQIHIHSRLPVAAGLGSGASVSVALAKALCAFFSIPFTDQEISDIAFEAEKQYHGTPSGIDNTVIAFERGIFFQREKPVEWLKIAQPNHILIVNSGEEKSTKGMVERVREQFNHSPQLIQPLLDQIGEIAVQARSALEIGNPPKLGSLMVQNHQLLQALGVSTPGLDRMVQLAMENGALGAKLSGAGGGGNMIILMHSATTAALTQTFAQAGYTRQIQTIIQ
jgi:mevalonate kinase